MESDADWRTTVDAVLAQYGVTADRVEPIRTTNNAVFRVRCDRGGDLALRLHRPDYRTETNVRSELLLLEALLADGSVAAPEPVRTLDGTLVAALPGVRPYATMVTWLPGDALKPGHGAGLRRLRRIGETLAKLHRFAESFVAPAGFDLPEWDVDGMLSSESPFQPGRFEDALTRAELARIEDVATCAEDLFVGLEKLPSTFGVIHNDYILQHCLHTRLRVAVIDFDDAGWGFYLQDLGGMLGNLKDYPSYRSLRESFFDGYRSVRPLPSERESDLEAVIAIRHAMSVSWLVGVRRTGVMDEERFQLVLDDRMTEIERSLNDIAASSG